MSGTKATIASVFDRLQSRDKDFRYMATSDLIEMLKDPAWKQDADVERRLCDQIVAQLDDSSSDVSSLAVKCLGFLVQRVQHDKADKILDTLCTRLVSGKKEADRESASISLKTTILDLPADTAKAILRHIVPKLLKGTQTQEPADVAAASLDIMNDVLSKFGHMLGPEQVQLKDILLQGLVDPKPIIRKRSVSCLASLVPYLPDPALEQVARHVMKGLQGSKRNEDSLRIWSQALGAVGRSAGWRFGPFVGQAIPLVVDSWRSAPEMDDELRELCLAALEGFVLRCPQASRSHLDAILDVVQTGLSYDPNYADDMEQDDDEEAEEDEDDMSDEQYSDDDDASWKVRRGAAKLLAAVYTNYSGDLDALYPKTVPSLLSRFREREENVKADVFHAFVVLLQQATARASRDRDPGVMEKLLGDAPDVLKASLKQLRDKSLKTRTGILILLKELLASLPDNQISNVDQLLPGVISAINDHSSNSSQLRIQALQFLGVALKSTSPAVWQKHVKGMADAVTAAAGERYSMVSAEGLRVCESLVYVMRPDPSKAIPSSQKGAVGAILQAVKARLTAQDQDQEVKECAVSCAAALVAQLGDALQQEYGNLMQGLLEKLQSDTTRLAAVKAFGRIAESPLPLDMAPVLDRLLTELTSYLRKSNRLLRQAALAAIEAVTARQGAALSSERMAVAVDEVANLVTDSDLLATPLALRFCLKLLPQQPKNADQISSRFLPAALQLVKSPLLQGAALDEVLAFFPAVLASGSSAVTFDSMLSSLLGAGNGQDTSKTAQHNIARCIASLAAPTSQQQVNAVVKGLLTQLQTGNGAWAAQGETRGRKRAASQETAPGADSVRRLALLSIGRIGRQANLKDFPQMQQTLTSALAGSSEDIKGAASLALGGVAIGDLDTHLPFIIRQIMEQAKNPKDQYLLLKALNEVIVSISSGSTGKQLSLAHQQQVLSLLLGSCEGEEECRSVVAECMGHLALLNPTQVLPEVLKLHTASSPGQRCVVVTAVKVATVPQPHPIDDALRPAMLPLLQLISDPDRSVRKAAVQMLSSAAHSKASLVAAQLPAVLPQLYRQTVIDPSLIRTVDLGPFKHKIDDGLELRKATFECMDVLLDTCADRLDYTAFLEHLESGLKDHYDVKLPCHLLLAKLAAAAPGQLLANLHRLTEPLEKTLQTKVKGEAVKQEVDRNEDMIRSALRAVDAISRIPNVDACVPFKQLMQNVVLHESLAAKFRAVRDERAEVEGAFTK